MNHYFTTAPIFGIIRLLPFLLFLLVNYGISLLFILFSNFIVKIKGFSYLYWHIIFLISALFNLIWILLFLLIFTNLQTLQEFWILNHSYSQIYIINVISQSVAIIVSVFWYLLSDYNYLFICLSIYLPICPCVSSFFCISFKHFQVFFSTFMSLIECVFLCTQQ